MKNQIIKTKEFGDLHDDSIVSTVFSKYDNNRILTISKDGSMRLFDIRMERILKKYLDCDLYCSGRSKVSISSGGQLVFVMNPSGQI